MPGFDPLIRLEHIRRSPTRVTQDLASCFWQHCSSGSELLAVLHLSKALLRSTIPVTDRTAISNGTVRRRQFKVKHLMLLRCISTPILPTLDI